jgi:hypothetical protein
MTMTMRGHERGCGVGNDVHLKQAPSFSRKSFKEECESEFDRLTFYSEKRMSSFSVRTGRVWRHLKVPSGQIRSA